jgi:hypothetical protein
MIPSIIDLFVKFCDPCLMCLSLCFNLFWFLYGISSISRGCLWSKLIVSVSLEYLWYQSTTPNFHDAPISISGRAMLSVRRSTLIRGYFTFLYVLNTYVYVVLSSICGLEPRHSPRWLHREFQLPGSWCVVKYAPYHPIMPFFFSDSSFYKMLYCLLLSKARHDFFLCPIIWLSLWMNRRVRVIIILNYGDDPLTDAATYNALDKWIARPCAGRSALLINVVLTSSLGKVCKCQEVTGNGP